MGDLTSRDFKRAEHHEFYKLLRDTSPSGSFPFYQIFQDFLTLSHAALYQPVHKLITGKISAEVEAEYMRCIGKYDKERAKNFSAAIAVLVNSLHAEMHDFLGDVYGSTGISNHWAGQFFTPWPLCQAMAKMTFSEVGRSLRERRLTVMEPAVGGGAMLLAAAVELKEAKLQPWHWWFEAIDVDLRCAQMAYIQLTLAGAPGVVRHGNTLKWEFWNQWPTLTGAMFPHVWPKAEPQTGSAPPQVGQMQLQLAA